MKVLFVIDGLGTGGAERSLSELLAHLEARGVSCHVAYQFDRPGGVAEIVRERASSVHHLTGRRAPQRARQLRALIRELQPDVVHTNLYASSILGRVASIGTGAAVTTSLVSTPYSAERRADPAIRPLALRGVQLIDAATARLCNTGFHAVSQTVAEAAVEALHIDPDRICVVERGRDVGRLGEPGAERRAAVRDREGIGQDTIVLIAAGRHVYQKGQRYLIEAMPTIVAHHPDTLVLVAGREATETALLESLVDEHGLADHVRLLGQRQDLPDLLAASDAFVMPSLLEGAAGAALEAHALALPVIASDIPALREALRDGEDSVLVPLSDPPALAAAVIDLIDDPAKRTDMGAQGRSWFQEHHGIDRAADRTVEMYADLVRRRRGG